jgi:hypothetical protein
MIPIKKSHKVFISEIFKERGYIKTKKGTDSSHQGWEIRLSIIDKKEEKLVKEVLEHYGFYCGKSFKKHNRFIVPIYGKEQAQSFLNNFGIRKKRK